MSGFIYQADVYCGTCGQGIADELAKTGNAPADPENEHTFDSDDYPKYADHENEESDSPRHCAGCQVFLENPLTSDGYQYVKDELDSAGATLSDVHQTWVKYYQFQYSGWKSPEMED